MPKKRSNGEGYLHKRPNGLWECQIMVGYQADGRKKMKSFYGQKQKEARDKAREYLDNLNKQAEISEETTFSQWADTWYASMKGEVSESTYEGYRYTLRILKEFFGDEKLTKIKAIHIENFLKKMTSEGKSHSYITKMRGMLFQIMKKAEANDLIMKNPVAVADKQRYKDTAPKKDSFTVEEIDRMMERLPDNRIGNSIRLMLGTGMRTQEIMGLMPTHIDEDGSCIHIRQAVTMVKGTPKIGPPKTKTSYRDIPVPLSLRETAKKLRSLAAPYIPPYIPLIWHGVSTPICNPSQFRKQFKSCLQAIGGVRLLSPHCCRHTYVSQLQAASVPLETIQSMTGHADIDMTQHYLHVQREVKEVAAGKLDSLFTKTSLELNSSTIPVRSRHQG